MACRENWGHEQTTGQSLPVVQPDGNPMRRGVAAPRGTEWHDGELKLRLRAQFNPRCDCGVENGACAS